MGFNVGSSIYRLQKLLLVLFVTIIVAKYLIYFQAILTFDLTHWWFCLVYRCLGLQVSTVNVPSLHFTIVFCLLIEYLSIFQDFLTTKSAAWPGLPHCHQLINETHRVLLWLLLSLLGRHPWLALFLFVFQPCGKFSRSDQIPAIKIHRLPRPIPWRHYFWGLCVCFVEASESFDSVRNILVFGDVIDVHGFRNRKYRLMIYYNSFKTEMSTKMDEELSYATHRKHTMKFKIVFIGDQSVGKSSIINRFIKN